MLADLNLYHRQEVEDGIREDDFFERNKEALSDMRDTYEARVPKEIREQRNHLDLAIKTFIAKKRDQMGLE